MYVPFWCSTRCRLINWLSGWLTSHPNAQPAVRCAWLINRTTDPVDQPAIPLALWLFIMHHSLLSPSILILSLPWGQCSTQKSVPLLHGGNPCMKFIYRLVSTIDSIATQQKLDQSHTSQPYTTKRNTNLEYPFDVYSSNISILVLVQLLLSTLNTWGNVSLINWLTSSG